MARVANTAGATIARRERNGSTTVWVREDLLLSVCEGLSETELRKHCRYEYTQTVPKERRSQDMMPDTGAQWRYWKLGKTWYYAHNRVGKKYRPEVEDEGAWWVERGEAMEATKLREGLTELMQAAMTTEWERYLKHYVGYAQATGLAKAAAMVAAVSEWIEGEMSGAKVLPLATWMTASEQVNVYHLAYVPTNYRRLQEKVTRVLAGELPHEVVKLPREGNKNRKPYEADDEIMAWVVAMRQRPENWPNVYIARKLRVLCAQTLKPVPSVRWFEERMTADYVKYLTDRQRGGIVAKRAKGHGMPMQTAVWAGDRWEMDGTRRNYLPWRMKDSEGKKREQYLYIVALRDVHSGDVPGWCYGVTEDRWMYAETLRMAVRECGYLPAELVIDRFPGHNSPEWQALELKLKYYGVKVTYAETGDKKARVERWFGTLQTVFDNESGYYYGEGIKSRRHYAHRAEKYLKEAKAKAWKDGWNMERAIEESDKALEAYRQTSLSVYSRKHSGVDKSPAALHQESDKPAAIECDWQRQMELFGYEKPVTLDGYGTIRTEIQKVEYFYVTEEYAVISQYREVTLVYDIDDLNTALLYTRHDDPMQRELLCEVTLMERVTMNTMGKEKARRARIEAQREVDLAKWAEKAEPDEMALMMGRYTSKVAAEEAESVTMGSMWGGGGATDEDVDWGDVRLQY